MTLNPYHRRALERIAAMPGGMLAYGAVAIAQDALHAAAYGDRGPCPHCAPLEHAGTSAGGYETSPGTPQTEGAHLAVEKTGAANTGAGSENDERAVQLEREHRAGGLPQLEREHRAP